MEINQDILREELAQLELSFYEMKYAQTNFSVAEAAAKEKAFVIEKNKLLTKYNQNNMVDLRQLLK